MRISIAMATYDGSQFVEAQLESFAAQTRLPDELVVCDDCSTDDTQSKLEAFAARAPFEFRFERNPSNLGTTANFGKALERCSGELIFLSDQDDVWRAEKIETMERVFAASPKVGAVFSNGRVVDAAGAALEQTLWDGVMFDASEQQLVREGRASEVFLRHVVAAGCTLAFRSSYRDLYLPLPELHSAHDAWIAFLIAAVAEVAMLEEPLIDYRAHGDNQFGLRRLSLREQLEKARWQLEQGIFDYGVRFFGLALQRLGESGYEVEPRLLSQLRAKIEHFRRRSEMSPRLLRRLPDIFSELAAGNYGRFSYGMKSVAQDLLLR